MEESLRSRLPRRRPTQTLDARSTESEPGVQDPQKRVNDRHCGIVPAGHVVDSRARLRRLQRQPVEALNHYIFFAGAGYDQCIGTDWIQAAQCRVNA